MWLLIGVNGGKSVHTRVTPKETSPLEWKLGKYLNHVKILSVQLLYLLLSAHVSHPSPRFRWDVDNYRLVITCCIRLHETLSSNLGLPWFDIGSFVGLSQSKVCSDVMSL